MKQSGLIKLFASGIIALIAAIFIAKFFFASTVDQVVNRFESESIKTEFVSYATRIHSSHRLQFATLTQAETFERKSEKKVFWDRLQLPQVVVAARLPVQYTYYVEIDRNWIFDKDQNVLNVVVNTPKFNPPAADISSLYFEVKKGSLFRSEQYEIDKLKSQLTDRLAERAKENLELVREKGRRTLETFIKEWLLKDDPPQNLVVNLTFRDEMDRDTSAQESRSEE